MSFVMDCLFDVEKSTDNVDVEGMEPTVDSELLFKIDQKIRLKIMLLHKITKRIRKQLNFPLKYCIIKKDIHGFIMDKIR